MPTSLADNNKRIAKNTVFLYFRMMLLMVVALYTSRVYLEALGIIDTGIYQIVGGLVSAFVFLNSSLSGATSRFLTFELGRGNNEKLKKTFATALNIHICLALFIVFLLETVGLWFLENKMVIPEERMNAARIVYQFSVLSCLLGITQVPYSASIISHERMNIYAYVSILDAVLKLMASYLLFVIPYDRLIIYGLLILGDTFLIQIIYRFYCVRCFQECHFRWFYDKEIVRPMLSFSMWDIFGNFGVMMRGQGVNIVLNLFFGPAINAACGFSNYVQGAVRGFTDNFMTAVRPSIVKTYSVCDYTKMQIYMINASKFSFFLMALLSVPLILEIKFIIDLWLKTPPVYTYEFCIISLGINLVRVLFSPLMFGIHATGKVRDMSIANGFILILIVPISYILLRLGANPLVPFVVDFFLMFFLAVSCAFFLKRNMPEFSISHYVQKSTIPSLCVGIPVFIIAYLVKGFFTEESFFRFIIICISSTVATLIFAYWIGIDKGTRIMVLNKIQNRVIKRR